MIISNSNPIKIAAKLYGEQTKVAKSGSTAKTGPVQQKDEVILSPEAQEISLAQKALKAVPEVRADKVKAFSDQISAGTYSVKAEDIAQKMLDGGLPAGLR